MDTIGQLRQAVQHSDLDAFGALLAPEAQFSSPVRHYPFTGYDVVLGVFRQLFDLFDSFTYTNTYIQDGHAPAGPDSAVPSYVLKFHARLKDVQVRGVDIVHFNPHGLISYFEVMVRGKTAVDALAAEMGVKLRQARLISD